MQNKENINGGGKNKRLVNNHLFSSVTANNKREQLRQRFGKKSWCEDRRWWKTTATLCSYVFQIVSVVAAFYGGLKILQFIGAPTPLAAALSIALLVLLEFTKRRSSDHVWDIRWSQTRFDWSWVQLSFFLFLISAAVSGFGIYQGTKDFAPQADLITNDSTLTLLNQQLANINTATSEAAKTKNEEGVIFWPMQRAIEKFAEGQNMVAASIIERSENIDRENNQRLQQQAVTVAQAAMIGLCVCFILELLFEICMRFNSLFDFRDYLETEGLTAQQFHSAEFQGSQQFQDMMDNLPPHHHYNKTEVGFKAIENRLKHTGTSQPETVGNTSGRRLGELLSETLGTPVITTFQDSPRTETKVIVSTETVPDVEREISGQIRRIQRYNSKLEQGIGKAATAYKNIADALKTINELLESGTPTENKMEQIKAFRAKFEEHIKPYL